jgi:F-type H+-transporting ATPase subunit a
MSHGHCIVEREIFGQAMSFNMDTLVTMWVAMAFLLIVSLVATRKLSIFPTKIQLVFEKILDYFDGLVSGMIHEGGRRHFPLVASLFLFIVTANLMGQLPL